MNSNNSDISIILKNESFLYFLKFQVKGFIEDIVCSHSLSGDVCLLCIKKFIEGSDHKTSFIHLYDWFNQTKKKPQKYEHYFNHLYSWMNPVKYYQQNHNVFNPVDIVNCFESIYNYLSLYEASYFKSSWLEGMFSIETPTTLPDTFSILCSKGHLDTLKWLYECEEQNIKLTDSEQKKIFMNICKQKNFTNTEILEWLLSLKIFNRFNINIDGSLIFQTACEYNNIEVVKFLLGLDGYNRKINIHANNERAFYLACSFGSVELVQLLLELEGENSINVHVNNENAFLGACYNKNIGVIRLLLGLRGDQKINARVLDHRALRYAYRVNHTEVVKLLSETEYRWDWWLYQKDFRFNDDTLLSFSLVTMTLGTFSFLILSTVNQNKNKS